MGSQSDTWAPFVAETISLANEPGHQGHAIPAPRIDRAPEMGANDTIERGKHCPHTPACDRRPDRTFDVAVGKCHMVLIGNDDRFHVGFITSRVWVNSDPLLWQT